MATKEELKKLNKGQLIGFSEVVKNISEAMTELDGGQITELHNKVCGKKVKYYGDSIWEYTGEDDNQA